MRRACGILFGVATHALFAVTVWHLVRFLAGSAPRGAAVTGSDLRAAAVDGLLAAFFAVPHSVLLLPAVRSRLVKAGIGGPFYGCFFCVVTCLTLLVTILCWQPSAVVVWRWPGAAGTAVRCGFVASWGALLYSLHLTGLGWQTGLTPWWRWVRGQPPLRREFAERGAYRVLRHPVYLSFLGLVWLTPVVTLDRAVLVAVWTGYILVGSTLKDRRLLFFMGDEYRSYMARVPGYPGMPAGPLARVPGVARPPLAAATAP